MGIPPVIPSSPSRRETSLVESGPQAVDGVERNAPQTDWHGFDQLDFVKILGSVRVFLDDLGVWVGVEECGNFPLKFCGAALGVR